jgi:hypothetical protein
MRRKKGWQTEWVWEGVLPKGSAKTLMIEEGKDVDQKLSKRKQKIIDVADVVRGEKCRGKR